MYTRKDDLKPGGKTVTGIFKDRTPSPNADWLYKFCIATESGEIGLEVVISDHPELVKALDEERKPTFSQLPMHERGAWEFQYIEKPWEKNGKSGFNNTVTSAKKVNVERVVAKTAAKAAPPHANNDKNNDIRRAVAFKGAIELVAARIASKKQGKTSLPPAVEINRLTDEFDKILAGLYVEVEEAVEEEVIEDMFPDEKI